jgi:hypothetical protein
MPLHTYQLLTRIPRCGVNLNLIKAISFPQSSSATFYMAPKTVPNLSHRWMVSIDTQSSKHGRVSNGSIFFESTSSSICAAVARVLESLSDTTSMLAALSSLGLRQQSLQRDWNGRRMFGSQNKCRSLVPWASRMRKPSYRRPKKSTIVQYLPIF